MNYLQQTVLCQHQLTEFKEILDQLALISCYNHRTHTAKPATSEMPLSSTIYCRPPLQAHNIPFF